jgi:hypothetical protein
MRSVRFISLLLLLTPAAARAQHAARAWPVVQPPLAPTAQEQERHTKEGLIIGTALGTATGFGIGTFIKLLCETESDDCDKALPVITVLGAVSGAIAGAIIGSAIPKGRRDPDVTPTEVPVRDRIGSASISIGAGAFRLRDAVGITSRGNGAVMRANVYAELKPWLALGPEVGIVRGGEAGSVRHGALSVRASMDRDRFSPFVAANLGAYQSTGPSLEYLGAGIAVGTRYSHARDSRFFLDIESRFQRNAQNIEPMRAAVLSVGAGTYW